MLQTIAIITGCMMTERLDLKCTDIIYTAEMSSSKTRNNSSCRGQRCRHCRHLFLTPTSACAIIGFHSCLYVQHRRVYSESHQWLPPAFPWRQIDRIFSSVLPPPEKIENTMSKEDICFVRTLSFICPIFDDFTLGLKIIKPLQHFSSLQFFCWKENLCHKRLIWCCLKSGCWGLENCFFSSLSF